MATNQNITRRQAFQGGSLALLASALPAQAETWRPEVETVEQAILAHVREIAVLLRESAPDGATVDGFMFFLAENEVDLNTVRATANIDADHFARFDPAVSAGWNVHTRQWRV